MTRPQSKPNLETRILLFIFAALPGAYGVAAGGMMLGFALCGPSGTGTLESTPWIAWCLVAASPLLLLIGLGCLRQPLYLFVFVPMPTLMAAGYYLREYRDPKLGGITFLGLIAPVVAYIAVRFYYRRKGLQNEARA